MEIRQLRHFIAAAEAGNLRKASENIHISHPALSMSIKNLETDLGVALFFKNRQGVQMTYAGEQFLQTAHSLLRQMDDVRASLHGTEESPTGNVRLGIPYGPNNALAAPLFKILLERFPGINLQIEEGNTTSLGLLYDDNMLDLMIGYDAMEKTGRNSEPLYIEHLYFLCAYDPKLEGIEEIQAKDLIDPPIVASPGTHSMRKTLEKFAFDNGVRFEFFNDFQSAHSSLKIAEAGLANAICPWDHARDFVASKRLSARKIVSPSMERTLCLVSPVTNIDSFATMAIIDAIKSAIQDARDQDNLRGRSFFDAES